MRYTVSFLIVLSSLIIMVKSGGSNLSKKIHLYSMLVQALTYSHKKKIEVV